MPGPVLRVLCLPAVIAMTAVTAVTAAAGCGRLGFDDAVRDAAGAGDAPPARPSFACLPGHDEDADGIVDCEDVCPHRADRGQLDSDGDSVGDACDPYPASRTERVAVFEPFVTAPVGWEVVGTYTFHDDSVDIDGDAGYWIARAPLSRGHDVLEIAGHATESFPLSGSQLYVGGRAPGGALYYCELLDQGSAPVFKLTYSYDNVTYGTVQAVSTPAVGNDDFMIRLTDRSPQVDCYGQLGATTHEIGGTVPADIVPGGFVLQAQGVRARLDYFVQITSTRS